jgi:glycosyltransferase involved in cell wall biosynthesis
MRILHTVESYLPSRHGMSEVVRQISENLVKKGHSVFVATKYDKKRISNVINGVNIVSFDITGNMVNGYTGNTVEYINFLLSEKFDIITNFAAQQWATDLCFDILPNIISKKYFVPTGFSNLYNKKYDEYFIQMKKWMKLYNKIIFLSYNYRDINYAKSLNLQNYITIPNGASLLEFENPINYNIKSKLNIPIDYKTIIHVGSYTGVKGHDEAFRIFKRSKLKKAAIIFIGENFEDESLISFKSKISPFSFSSINRNFSFKNLIRWFVNSLFNLNTNRFKKYYLYKGTRAEIVSLYSEADLLLFPSKIECSPVVLFESIASKTPFLTTDVGNAKEIIEWTNGGLLLPTYIDNNGLSYVDEQKAALILSNIFNNKNLLQTLSKDGHNAWVKNYTWEKISNTYLNLYIN